MTRVLLLGLDGATWTVLDPFLDGTAPEGVVMPCLASLRARGHHAVLHSAAHPLTPPAWTSVATGRTPGSHGVFDFVRFEDLGDEVFFTLFDFRDIRVPTIWQLAGDGGRTVASLNFPMMAPPPPVNGTLVPGFVSWKHLRRNSRPPELFDRLKDANGEFGGFDIRDLSWDFERESQIGDVMADEELHAWVERHLPRDRAWAAMGLRLLREDRPDLFALMLDGTDKIQHQAWHALDPALWRGGDTDAARAVRALVVRYFRELDGAIRALVEAAPDAHVIVVSDHGFTGSDKVVRINLHLERLGHLAWRPSDGSEAARRRDMSNFANLDWARTRAFAPTPSSNGIVIRRRSSACPAGVPPEEHEGFRRQLIADLLALRDPDTGAPVVAAVRTREEAYPGAAMDAAPDLLVTLADHGFVSVRNREPVVVTRPVPLGTHHPDGILVMAGPGVRAGRGEALEIADTAAIALHCLGLPVPSDFEGRVPPGLFDDAWLAANPVRTGPPAAVVAAAVGGTVAEAPKAAAPAPARGAEDEQREEMLAQLRLLGYIED